MNIRESLLLLKQPLDEKKELREVERLIENYEPNSVSYNGVVVIGDFSDEEVFHIVYKIWRTAIPQPPSYWVRKRSKNPFEASSDEWVQVRSHLELSKWQDLKITEWVYDKNIHRR